MKILHVSLILLFAALMAPTGAHAAMPAWTDRSAELSGPLARPEADAARRARLDGELADTWLCVPGGGRCRLEMGDGRFAYDDAMGKARGAMRREGALLRLIPDDGSPELVVFWQLLGDGRLAINGGERILHREGRSPTPISGEREFGHRTCRFTIELPADATVEEIEDGVRVYTFERDAGVQVVSGQTKLSAREFALLMAMDLGGKPQEEKDGSWSLVTETREGIPLYARVSVADEAFITFVITGDPSKVAWVARSVRVLRPDGPEGNIPLKPVR